MPSEDPGGPPPSSLACVRAAQALVSRELVEGLGVSERQAGRYLGLVASSVSQYLSGKRLGRTLRRFPDDEGARRIARRAALRIVGAEEATRVILEAALALERHWGSARPPRAKRPESTLPPELRRTLPRWLRARIVGEQAAVAECMRLAQRSRDELTRALFRQIASDSLRHAEIVASLSGYLDRGVASSAPSGITRADVERLIRREQAAEASADIELGPRLQGMLRILWESMEADEKKHERLLRRLLDTGLADGRRRA
jgi:predicted transcriptional regulator/rubrerythrin